MSRKRPFLLLEALIAFILVVACLIPLIYPHVAIYRSQNEFIRKMELDHAVNLLYGNVLEKLYLNKITWSQLTQESFDIDDELLKEAGVTKPLAFKGKFMFQKEAEKSKEDGSLGLFKFILTFKFEPLKGDKQPLTFEYNVFLIRELARISYNFSVNLDNLMPPLSPQRRSPYRIDNVLGTSRTNMRQYLDHLAATLITNQG